MNSGATQLCIVKEIQYNIMLSWSPYCTTTKFNFLQREMPHFVIIVQYFKRTQNSVTSVVDFTPPIPEILFVKNVWAIVVCGFLIKFLNKTYPENLKKIVGAVWELPAKSSPIQVEMGWIFHIFRIIFLYYLIKNPQTTIALPFLTHNFHSNWGLALLFSR